MKCIITIELGTNAVRVFAFDLNGNVIGSQRGYYPTFHTLPDYSEQDPDQMFITMLYTLKNLLIDIFILRNIKSLPFVSAHQCIVYWRSTKMEILWGMQLHGQITGQKKRQK